MSRAWLGCMPCMPPRVAEKGAWRWEKKESTFISDTRRLVASAEEARKEVENNPETFMGYTVSGRLAYVCEHGSSSYKLDSSKYPYPWTSWVLSCKSLPPASFEDKYSAKAGRAIFCGGLENGREGGEHWEAVWKRPGRGQGLYDKPNLKLFGFIEPNDVIQGSVGDCSFIASVAALAEFPHAVRSLFPRGGALARDGKYEVKLWDWGSQQWKVFQLDDRFPCKEGDDTQAAFAKPSEEGEIFPMLLEKAAAVMAGGFDFCNSIMPTWALGVLTGCRDVFEFQLEGGLWTGWRSIYDGSSTFKSSRDYSDVWARGASGSQRRHCDQMWKYMAAWDDNSYLMCCGARAQGKTDTQDRDGVLYMHAYSVTQVRTNVAESGFDLVQLRNPHGPGGREPNLPWNDHDTNWDSYPEVARELDWHEKSRRPDGMFWMSREDFFSYFNTVYVVKCNMRDGGRARLDAPPEGSLPRPHHTPEGGGAAGAPRDPVWQFGLANGRWKAFEPECQQPLESAYANFVSNGGDIERTVKTGPLAIVVNFKDMSQHVQGRGYKRKVRRQISK